MAKNGTACDVYREPSVYVSAEIQGYLEKKKGVLGAKTKQWCSLQGLTLYLQKKRSDVVETIDLTDVNQVRKVTNENTGTHFEICMTKKKSHIFICPSNGDCLAWIKALEIAIARKNTSQQSSSFVTGEVSVADDRHVYNEIDEALMRESCVRSTNLSETQPYVTSSPSDYTEPEETEISVRKFNSDYTEVGDFRNTLRQSSSASVYDDNNELSTPYATIDQVCCDKLSEAAGNPECTYIYSQVNKVKKSTLLHTSSVLENGIAQAGDTIGGNLTSAIILNSVVVKESTSNEGNNIAMSENLQIKRPEAEMDINMCQILVDAVADCGCTSYDYIHPLTEEDRKPVKELTEFLKNNRDICRASYSYMSKNSDPVSTLKSYLATLDISARQMGND